MKTVETLLWYLGAYLCLLVALVYIWHRFIQGSGREPNGVSTAERVYPHEDAWPFGSATPEPSRPDDIS